MTDLPAGVTDEMVEAGARAACAMHGYDPDDIGQGGKLWTYWKDDTRTALTAALAGRVVVPRDEKKIERFVGMVRALLRHTNPCNVNEGHSQQWFAVNDECDRLTIAAAVDGEA